MPESQEGREQAETLGTFDARIEKMKQDGVYSHVLGREIPWAEATELSKVDAITWAALSVSLNGPAVPGGDTLAAVERNVDYDGLPPLQRDMVRDVRQKFDAGHLPGPNPDRGMDRTWKALNWIVGIDKFDRELERYKAEGLYDRPQNTPWAEVPESKKVSALVGLARHDGPPGAHALGAIEREVDYGQLPAWRREALEGLRAHLDAGTLDGDQPQDTRDRANYALRLAEFEARVEDYKHDGGQDDWGVYRRWKDFSEVEKLDKIVRETVSLNLHFEPREFEIIDREVDLARVPEGRRQGIESAREMTLIGPEEYQRRKEAKYAPPNEAAATFKGRIEEGLWTTCFTDGESIFADWSDLTPEAKLHELAKAMDWDRVPESYFRLMVEREMKIEDLPDEKRAALDHPKEARHALSAGFGSDVEKAAAAPEPGARPVRDTTRNLVTAIMLDTWPRAGAIVDFGLDSQEHYESLYYGVREGEITPEALDAALGSGEKLTALARSSPSNPHRDITFSTSWDTLPREPDLDGETVPRGKDAEALYAEWREDYASRARESSGQEPWQVWHQAGYPEGRITEMVGLTRAVFPDDYVHVASLPVASPEEAVRLTTHGGDLLEGTMRSWKVTPGVQAHVFAPRSTDTGDVVVDPSGQAYRVEKEGFRRIGAAGPPLLSPGEIAALSSQPEAAPDRGQNRSRGR